MHLLDRYSIEGPRTTDWLASGVVKRHRTLGSLLNLLIGFGLSSQTGGGVEPCDEQVAARLERPQLAQPASPTQLHHGFALAFEEVGHLAEIHPELALPVEHVHHLALPAQLDVARHTAVVGGAAQPGTTSPLSQRRNSPPSPRCW